MRRSTILSLPHILVFPGLNPFKHYYPSVIYTGKTMNLPDLGPLWDSKWGIVPNTFYKIVVKATIFSFNKFIFLVCASKVRLELHAEGAFQVPPNLFPLQGRYGRGCGGYWPMDIWPTLKVDRRPFSVKCRGNCRSNVAQIFNCQWAKSYLQ